LLLGFAEILKGVLCQHPIVRSRFGAPL